MVKITIKKQATIGGYKNLKIRSARKYVPKNALVGHKYSFGTVYFYGADNYFVPKRGWKVTKAD